MVPDSQSPADRLWAEYSGVFKDLDDLTLGRWLAQTLGQLHGRIWRLSHPLLGTYRLATQIANERDIWQKRVCAIPHGYHASDCCAAPILPLFSRDIKETGLICEHCGGTTVPFKELPAEIQTPITSWAKEYSKVHETAHGSEAKKQQSKNYQSQFEAAAKSAEQLLSSAVTEIIPQFLDFYPTIIWEDQDECLDVRPEDIGTA